MADLPSPPVRGPVPFGLGGEDLGRSAGGRGRRRPRRGPARLGRPPPPDAGAQDTGMPERRGVPAPPGFRPPYGLWNGGVRQAAAHAGERLVLWDVCLERYIHHYGVAEGVRRLVAEVRPGSIILAHDGGVP